MTKSFLIRARPSLISAINARAEQLGQNRSRYIVKLVERDLAEAKAQKPRKHKFVSYDLIGAYNTGIKSGDNATIRKTVRQRLKSRRP
jgi:hypothetical protein